MTIYLNSYSQSNFQHYYGGGGNEEAYAVAVTLDGGYALAGTTTSFGAGSQDYFIFKLDYLGNIEWQKTYGGSKAEIGFNLALEQTPDSGFVLTGSSASYRSSGYDIYLLKVDKSGNMLWNTKYNASGGDLFHGRSVLITNSEDIVILGSDASYVFGTSEGFLMRVDNNGALKWKKAYGGNLNDHFLQAVELPGSNMIVCGSTESFGAGSNDDGYIVKVDVNGNPIWGYRYGGSGFEGLNGCDLTSNLHLVCVGETTSFGAGQEDFLLVKIDSLGTLQWAKTYGGPGADIGATVKELGDESGFFIYGYTENFGAGNRDLLLIRIDINGNVIWSKTFGTTQNDETGHWANGSLRSTNDNGFAITGWSSGITVAGGRDLFLIKGDSLGSVLCSDVTLTVTTPAIVRNNAFPGSANVGTYATITSSTSNSAMIDSSICYCVPDSVCGICLPPSADAGNDISIVPGASSVLSGSGVGTYEWSPAEGLSCLTCQSPVANPSVTTTYYLLVTDSNGCSSLDSVMVTIDLHCGVFYVPNAFSPNEDGQNDVLYLYNNCIKELTFEIFDRWGEKVFESHDPKIGWNGSFNGTRMSSAVYAYLLKAVLITGDKLALNGNISLIR